MMDVREDNECEIVILNSMMSKSEAIHLGAMIKTEQDVGSEINNGIQEKKLQVTISKHSEPAYCWVALTRKNFRKTMKANSTPI